MLVIAVKCDVMCVRCDWYWNEVAVVLKKKSWLVRKKLQKE